MFLVDWFWDAVSYIGLAKKSGRILFLGLDNAGKTTLLQMLKDDRLAQHVPTSHPYCEELEVGRVRFKTFDLGGHETARRVWKEYFAAVDGIVFIVDAAAPERFEEARESLQDLLDAPELAMVPFAIIGNKIDQTRAVAEETLRQRLGIPLYVPDAQNRTRPVKVFMCSVIKRYGFGEAFKWLAMFLN